MNWTAYIDAYCERTAPGFWNEPLNALTNLAFWLAVLVVWWLARRQSRRLDAELWVMSSLLLLIGLASFAFHTLANRWSGAFDSLAIALYLHLWLAMYLRRVWAWPWRWAWVGVPAFALLAFVLARGWALTGIGPSGYLAAWSVLILVTLDAAWRRARMAWYLGAAVLVFACSLTLRQLDLPLCVQWRWGTHWAWHLLNATTLGLTLWALVIAPAGQRWPRSVRTL